MDTQSRPVHVVDLLIAAHEVAALNQGCPVVEMVMLDGEPDQPGAFTQFQSYTTDRRLEAVRLIAGPVAEVTMLGYEAMLRQPELDAVWASLGPKGAGRDAGRRLAELELDRAEVEHAAAEAVDIVLSRWSIVEMLAATLLEEGRLSGELVEEIWFGAPVEPAVWAEMVWREPDLAF